MQIKNCIIIVILLVGGFFLPVASAYAIKIDSSDLSPVASSTAFIEKNTGVGVNHLTRNALSQISSKLTKDEIPLGKDVCTKVNCSLLGNDTQLLLYNYQNINILPQFYTWFYKAPVLSQVTLNAGVLHVLDTGSEALEVAGKSNSRELYSEGYTEKHGEPILPAHSSVLLLSTGVVGLVGLMRRKSTKTNQTEYMKSCRLRFEVDTYPQNSYLGSKIPPLSNAISYRKPMSLKSFQSPVIPSIIDSGSRTMESAVKRFRRGVYPVKSPAVHESTIVSHSTITLDLENNKS